MREIPVVKYNKEEENKYLTFEVLESGTIYLNEYGDLLSYFTRANEMFYYNYSNQSSQEENEIVDILAK